MRTFIPLLFLISAIAAETLEIYKQIIRPEALVCKEQLGATDDEMNAMVNLQKDLYNEKAKCLSACVLERLGVMKDGSWTAVPLAHRLQVYNRAFAGDTNRLEVVDRIHNFCQVEADRKFGATKEGCQSAYDVIACLWDLTY